MAKSAADMLSSATEAQLDQSVEEYLKAECAGVTKKLKRHIEGKISDFETEAKKARQSLRDVGNQQSADEPSGQSSGALCEPFALVAVRGIHTRRVVKIEATGGKTKWTIGRSDETDICLAGDDEVSSQHAKASAPAAARPAPSTSRAGAGLSIRLPARR